MLALIVTTIVTSPLLSVLSITMLDADVKTTQSERFISEVAVISGGFGLKSCGLERLNDASVRRQYGNYWRLPHISRVIECRVFTAGDFPSQR
jgi:hypothetical protein